MPSGVSSSFCVYSPVSSRGLLVLALLLVAASAVQNVKPEDNCCKNGNGYNGVPPTLCTLQRAGGCDQCSSSYYALHLAPGYDECVKTCPGDTYQKDGKTCEKCSGNVEYCVSLDCDNKAIATSCAECADGYYVNGDGQCSLCTSNCAAGSGIGPNAPGSKACSVNRDAVCMDCSPHAFKDDTTTDDCTLVTTECGPGRGVGAHAQGSEEKSGNKDAKCASCNANSFKNGKDAGDCIECSKCHPGTGVGTNVEPGSAPCTATSERTCTTCLPGFFNHESHDGDDCTPCRTTCPAGFGVNHGRKCVKNHDRLCKQCPKNRYNDGNSLSCNVCTSTCPVNKGVDGTGGRFCTDEADAVCAPCSGSKPGTFLTCDGKCSLTCPAGTGVNVEGGSHCVAGVSDRVCAACPEGKFQDGSGLECTGCKKYCEIGTGINGVAPQVVVPTPVPTTRADENPDDGDQGQGNDDKNGYDCGESRQAQCAPCERGKTFNSEGNLECTSCSTTCTPGTGVDNSDGGAACTVSSNRVCGACKAGFYNSVGGLHCIACDGSLTPSYPDCPIGEGATHAQGDASECGGDSNLDCNACAAGYYHASATGTDCKACTTGACPVGTGENVGNGEHCSTTSDRVCGDVTEGDSFNPGDSPDATDCIKTCDAGTGTNGQGGSPCSESSQRVCGDCEDAGYPGGNPVGGQLTCTFSCNSCGAGTGLEYESAPDVFTPITGAKACDGNTEQQIECKACPTGTFNTGLDGSIQCTACQTACPVGYGIAYGTNHQGDIGGAACSASSDIVCKMCPVAAGSYSGWFNAKADSLYCDSACADRCARKTGLNVAGANACVNSHDHQCVSCPTGLGNFGQKGDYKCLTIGLDITISERGRATHAPSALESRATRSVTFKAGTIVLITPIVTPTPPKDAILTLKIFVGSKLDTVFTIVYDGTTKSQAQLWTVPSTNSKITITGDMSGAGSDLFTQVGAQTFTVFVTVTDVASEDDSGSSSSGCAIVTCVVPIVAGVAGGALIVGVAVYYYRRHRMQQDHGLQIQNHEAEQSSEADDSSVAPPHYDDAPFISVDQAYADDFKDKADNLGELDPTFHPRLGQ